MSDTNLTQTRARCKPASMTGPEIDQLGQDLLSCVFESVLCDTNIDSKGKTEDQIMAEVRKIALEWSKRYEMVPVIDFKPNLLARARGFKRHHENHQAILYYATWFEHWINGILIRRLRSLDEREITQMIRDVSLRGKFTWLLALVHGRRIPQKYVKAILEVAEFRNKFVHYKYKAINNDDPDEEEAKLKHVQRTAETAVRYLQTFEERHFFKGAVRGLLKKLRKGRNKKSK